MKKKLLLITAGIVFVIFVVLVWLYLFLYGTPENPGEVYANLGFSPANQPTTVTTPPPPQNLDTDTTTINTDTAATPLQQLTTRPVAGFTIISTASTTIARYVERGTGFMYDIDLTSGSETLVSQTTVPRVAEASFDSTGRLVAMTSYTGYDRTVFAGSITNDAFDYITLEPGAHSIAFSDTNNLLYAISNQGTTRGYNHNLETETRREVFSFDFVNTDVAWGREYDAIYLSTRPGEQLPSYVYTIVGTTVTPVLPPILGAHNTVTPHHTITTFAADGGEVRSVAMASDGTQHTLPLTIIPSKCTTDTNNINGLWCAAPVTVESLSYLEGWNKGIETSEDFIWYVDIKRETATMRANPDRLSGRTLDIDKITTDSAGRYLLLRDRTDQTLWLLDSDNL